MRKRTEWLLALGVVVVAFAIASFQEKRELEEEVKKYTSRLYRLVPDLAYEKYHKQ